MEPGPTNDRAVFEKVAYLTGRYEGMATKEDIARLEGKVETSVETLKGFINEAVSQSEITTLKGFLRNWTIGASILIPSLTAILAVLLSIILDG